ncbi:MAG: ribonuclease III [Chloroflexi bacterium]|nr:ribonuclease III [Chloroflexota bacterium]
MLSVEDSGLETPQAFAKRLALPVDDVLLLSRALTHRSYLNENPEALEDNERLEFLGDAVLDFVVGAWLYRHFPEMSEGEMTRLRAALVRTEQLGDFALQIELGRALRLGHGEEESGGRSRPAMLCAAFEAVIGALYLDAGVGAVETFVNPMLDEATAEISTAHGDRDPKSLLQEWVQARGEPTPIYEIVAESGPDHDKFFEVEVTVGGKSLARGEGRNKQAASKVAASTALQHLNAKEMADSV